MLPIPPSQPQIEPALTTQTLNPGPSDYARPSRDSNAWTWKIKNEQKRWLVHGNGLRGQLDGCKSLEKVMCEIGKVFPVFSGYREAETHLERWKQLKSSRESSAIVFEGVLNSLRVLNKRQNRSETTNTMYLHKMSVFQGIPSDLVWKCLNWAENFTSAVTWLHCRTHLLATPHHLSFASYNPSEYFRTIRN